MSVYKSTEGIYMKYIKTIITISISLFLIGCTDEQVAMSELKEQRLRQIEITGYSGFGCPSSLFVQTGFVAKNVFGESVKGVVCSSWFSDEVKVNYTKLTD